MRKVVLFIVFCGLLIIIGCNMKAKKAKTYHDEILKAVQEVVDGSLNFSDAVYTHQKTDALKATGAYTAIVEAKINEVDAKAAFGEDTMLRAASLHLLRFYNKSLQQEFKPFFESINSNEFSDKQAAIADSITDKFSSDEVFYWGIFDGAEKNFYKKYEIAKVEKD